MARFIKVNSTYVGPCLISVETITMVCHAGKDLTKIFQTGEDDEAPLIVNHSLEVVQDMLTGADAHCEVCVHFIDGGDGDGACTRRPPTINGGDATFPRLSSEFRCGEYQGVLND